jgi:hypothetical protein
MSDGIAQGKNPTGCAKSHSNPVNAGSRGVAKHGDKDNEINILFPS